MGFLQHYERLLAELEGYPDAPGNEYAADSHVLCDCNFNVACETGIRYPTLQAMLKQLNRDVMLIRIAVRSIPCYRSYPRLYHVVLSYPILQMGCLNGLTLVQLRDRLQSEQLCEA